MGSQQKLVERQRRGAEFAVFERDLTMNLLRLTDLTAEDFQNIIPLRSLRFGSAKFAFSYRSNGKATNKNNHTQCRFTGFSDSTPFFVLTIFTGDIFAGFRYLLAALPTEFTH
jgi:hypothetical protein